MSTISSISSNQVYPSAPTGIKKDFQDLRQALSSGDLEAARTAFTQLQNDTQKLGGRRGGQLSSKMQSDLKDLASALQTGNLDAAQKAFAAFQQEAPAVHHGHRRHRQDNDTPASAQAPSSPDPSSTTGADTSIDVTA